MAESAQARRYKFRQAIVTDVGLKREENQDCYGYAHTTCSSVYVVCDGMGGARGGATASSLAVDVILRHIFDHNGEINEITIREAIERANDAIFERAKKDDSLLGMGTTVVLIGFVGENAIVAHVGDSRAYLLTEGSLRRLSRDHTLVQELVDSGAITPDEAAHHPIAHMLTRSLGPTSSVDVDCVTLPEPVKAGDRFLICSDGLYNVVALEEIEEVLRAKGLEEATGELLSLTLSRGAPDNVTLEAIEVFSIDDASVSLPLPEEGKARVVTSAGEEIEEVERAEDEVMVQEAERDEEGVESSRDDIEQDFVLGTETADEGHEIDPLAQVMSTDDFHAAEERYRVSKEKINNKMEEPVPLPMEEDISSDSVHRDSSATTDGGKDLSSVRLQVAALGILVVSLVVIVGVIIFRPKSGKQIAMQPPIDVRPASTISLEPSSTRSLAPVESSSALSNGVISASMSSVSAEEAFPGSTVNTSEASISSSSEMLLSSASSVSSSGAIGWPSIVIVDGQDASRTLSSSSPSISSSSVAPEKSESNEYAKLIEAASTMRIPPAPKLKGIDTTLAPIDWEKEKAMTERLSASNMADGSSSESVKFLAEEERADIIKRKEQARDSIMDVDAKLVALDQSSEREMQSQLKSVNERLGLARKVSSDLEAELKVAQEDQRNWIKRKQLLMEKDPIRLVDEVVSSDKEVQEKKAEYEAVRTQYHKAFEDWQGNLRDPKLVPAIATLGRELRAKRSFLEQSVAAGIERGLARSTDDVANKALMHENINRYMERLSHHIGYIKGAQLNIDGRNVDAQQMLLLDRQRMIDELSRLRAKLNDEDELRYRKLDMLKGGIGGIGIPLTMTSR